MPSTSAKIAIKASDFLSKRRGFYLFKLLLSFAILSYLVSHLQPRQLLATLRTAQPGALTLACGLLPLNLGLQFLKWHYLLRSASRASITPRHSFHSLMAGFPLGLLTPGRWGELGRAFFLPQLNERKTMVLAAFEKVFDLHVSLVFGVFALLFLVNKNFLPQELLAPLLALLLLSAALLVFAFQPAVLKRLARPFEKRAPAKRSALRVLGRLSRKNLTVLWLLSCGFALVYSMQFVLLLRGFVDVSFMTGFAGVSAAFLAKSLLPISLGDLGVREGAAAFFFARMGVSPQAAFDASLLLFLINLLTPSLLGMVLVWKHKSHKAASKT